MKVTPNEAKALGDELGVNWNEISLDQFRMGLEVEWEHKDTVGGSWAIIAMIALDHLKEFPDYYTRLKKVERRRD